VATSADTASNSASFGPSTTTTTLPALHLGAQGDPCAPFSTETPAVLFGSVKHDYYTHSIAGGAFPEKLFLWACFIDIGTNTNKDQFPGASHQLQIRIVNGDERSYLASPLASRGQRQVVDVRGVSVTFRDYADGTEATAQLDDGHYLDVVLYGVDVVIPADLTPRDVVARTVDAALAAVLG